MSFIQQATATDLDLYGAGDLMTHVTLEDAQKDAAWALLKKHGALDLADMIGVNR